MKAATKSTPRAPRRATVKKRSVRVGASSTAKFSSEASAFIAAAVADGLAIQHRFKAEPIYARTGTGYMAPTGVAEIAAAKRQAKTRTGKR
jgi:hypothetical protein